MHVVFGIDLEGEACPGTTSGASAELGGAVVGPDGLLDILETRLALAAPRPTTAARIAAYLTKLRLADDEGRFFHRSLRADAWGVARVLLGERDALVAAGWGGGPVAGGGRRLDDLAAVEAAGDPPPPGRADRARRVIRALESGERSGLTRLIAADPADAMPPPWPELVAILLASGVLVDPAPPVLAPAATDGDLARLQNAMIGGGGVTTIGDGSFVRLRAVDEDRAAEALAGWLAADPEANDGLVLIRPTRASPLDGALFRAGLPRVGVAGASPLRGALQVLPLAFAVRWGPRDVRRHRELLLVPDGPIPDLLRVGLAKALADEPGVGGPLWCRAFVAAETEHARALEGGGRARAGAERRAALAAREWRAWLEDGGCDPEEGMPVAEARGVCSRVAAWAGRRHADTGDPVFAAAAGHAGDLDRALAASDGGRVTRAQLNRMIDDVIADGTPAPADAEAAPWTSIDRPGALWRPTDTLVWWNFVDDGLRPKRPWWSRAERAALTRIGVVPPGTADIARRTAWTWRRPVLSVSRRLILVTPDRSAGEMIGVHPFWHEIEAHLDADGDRAVTVDVGDGLALDGVTFAGRRLARKTLLPTAPPPPERLWPLPSEVVTKPERETPTTLERLLSCRLRYVFDHLSGIRPGAPASGSAIDRVLGILTHAVIARLFEDGWPSTPEDGRSAARSLVEAWLPERAAELLLPENRTHRREALDVIPNAVAELIRRLDTHGLTVVACETGCHASVDGFDLDGRIDILARDGAGRPVILDVKWARTAARRQRRREACVKGHAVTLAAYHMLAGADGPAPSGTAFFHVFEPGLAAQGDVFGEAALPDAPAPEVVWQNVLTAREAHLAEFIGGEAVADGKQHPAPKVERRGLALDAVCDHCAYGGLCGVEWKDAR